MILSIPWLIISIVIYNMIAFSSAWPGPGAAGTNVFNDTLFNFDLISGRTGR